MMENNLQETLIKLSKTIEMIEGLEDSQFFYGLYISDPDFDDNCGTKCCVAGWLPTVFPESFYYRPNYPYMYLFFRNTYNSSTHIDNHCLMLFYGLSDDIISCLFYGKELMFFHNGCITFGLLDENATLSVVLHRFKEVYGLLNSGVLSPHFAN